MDAEMEYVGASTSVLSQASHRADWSLESIDERVPDLLVLSEAQTELVHCSHLRLRSLTDLGEDQRAHPSIWVCLSGCLDGVMYGIRFTMDATTAFIRPAGACQLDRVGGDDPRVLVIELKPAIFEHYPPLARFVRLPAAVPGATDTAHARWLLSEVASREDDTKPIRVDQCVLAYLSQILRSAETTETSPAWLNEVIEYLNDNYLDHITVKDLALRFRLHPTYVGRVFKQELRTTVLEYLTRLRIEHAVRLISTTNDALSEISETCGFKDQARFSRTFKERMRLTPSAYRRAASASRELNQ